MSLSSIYEHFTVEIQMALWYKVVPDKKYLQNFLTFSFFFDPATNE